MTKVKICGITREEDAKIATALGADFLGFVFVRESPRYVEPEEVRAIHGIQSPLPTAVRLRRGEGTGCPLFVGVFRDESIETVRRIAQIARLDLVQLHGDEDDDYVRALGLHVIKAFTITNAIPEATSSADWIMYDTGGGTGRRFDWSLLARHSRTKPFFLAGGLTAENAGEAIRTTQPDAVDVSSGVESAPGIKDHQKLRDFFERVRGS